MKTLSLSLPSLLLLSITFAVAPARADEPPWMPPQPPSPLERQREHATELRNVGIFAAAAGGALLVGMGAYAVATLSSCGLFESNCPSQDAVHTITGLAVAGLSLGALGAALTATGQSRLNAVRRHELRIAPTLGGAVVSGRF